MPLPIEEEEDSSVDENEISDMNFEYNTGEHGNNLKSSTQNDGSYEEESYKSKNDNIAFIDVISDMISTGHADGHQPDNLLMEIKGYKFAQNKV